MSWIILISNSSWTTVLESSPNFEILLCSPNEDNPLKHRRPLNFLQSYLSQSLPPLLHWPALPTMIFIQIRKVCTQSVSAAKHRKVFRKYLFCLDEQGICVNHLRMVFRIKFFQGDNGVIYLWQCHHIYINPLPWGPFMPSRAPIVSYFPICSNEQLKGNVQCIYIIIN